jgi:hypothetical protein
MTLQLAALEWGLKHYLAIVAGGVLVALLGLALRKPLGGGAVIPGWLAASISGFLIGAGVAFALLFQLGYRWSEQPPVINTVGNVVMGGVLAGQGGAPPGGAPGMGAGGPPGMGGPGGGNRPAVTPNTLAGLVGKLDLLDRGVKLEITNEQAAKLKAALADIEREETMSNEDAEKAHNACMEILTEEQKAVLASIDLPRRRGGGGGPGGGGPGGPGGGAPGGPGGGAPGGPGGGAPGGPGGGGPGGPGGGRGGGNAEPPRNPFHGEDGSKPLTNLRERLDQRAN